MPEVVGDQKFSEILLVLTEIHSEFPDIKFGHVIQLSIDLEKRSHNVNLCDKTSKDILQCLKNFQAATRNARSSL